MTGKYLLDTNVVIALFAKDPGVLGRIQTASEVFISSTVLGELLYGAEASGQKDKNLETINSFVVSCPVLACDRATAVEYGRIKMLLKRKGRPIPENDIWIAAVARQHGLTVVSRDTHFVEVDSLDLEQW